MKDCWGCATFTIEPLVLVQSLSRVQLFVIPLPAAHQASLSFTISPSFLKLMSTEWVMPSNRLILCHPLLLLTSVFPSIRSFPVSQLFISGDQSIGASASASVPPMKIQVWFPLGLTDLILLSKGLSRAFSSTPVRKHQFFSESLLYGPTLTSIHDYWKSHSSDYTNLCRSTNVSAF